MVINLQQDGRSDRLNHPARLRGLGHRAAGPGTPGQLKPGPAAQITSTAQGTSPSPKLPA